MDRNRRLTETISAAVHSPSGWASYHRGLPRAGGRHDAGGGQHPAVRPAARRCVVRAGRDARLGRGALHAQEASAGRARRRHLRDPPPVGPVGHGHRGRDAAPPGRLGGHVRDRDHRRERRPGLHGPADLPAARHDPDGIPAFAPAHTLRTWITDRRWRTFRRRCTDDAAAVLDSALRGDRDGVVGTFDAAVDRGGLKGAYEVAWCLAATMVGDAAAAGRRRSTSPASSRRATTPAGWPGSSARTPTPTSDRRGAVRRGDGRRTAVRVSADARRLGGGDAEAPGARRVVVLSEPLIQVFA